MKYMCEKIKSALIAYFDYQDNKVGNGYPSLSTVAKIDDSSITHFTPCARVPKGVAMTELDFIKLVNTVEASLIKLRDNNFKLFLYIVLRYKYQIKNTKIAELLNCCTKTCGRLHKEGLSKIKI